eukprot:TRINITY_DN1944_c3_g1_i1.p1 TRINITY_DN1944_c3_g1~~TRINITY_DN1944_c3_g1_i1.p1  ORF type:complete len:228 (+),score=33.80 TRINITY_DN1944_c3_g1_i1:38-685(+)
MSFFRFNLDHKKTFKPQKSHKKGSQREKLHRVAEATLGSGDMSIAVCLPAGENIDEWIAVNTVDFFNEINLLFGTISEFCTAKTCPVMSAGSSFQYLWADGSKIKTPIKVPANEYVDLLMTWCDGQLSCEELFPTRLDQSFPPKFVEKVKPIYKRLFRVYAHIYHSHFQQVVELGAEAHLNTCFKHFIYFVKEFHLIDKNQLAPLRDLIDKLMKK